MPDPEKGLDPLQLEEFVAALQDAARQPMPTVEEMTGMSLQVKAFVEEHIPGMSVAFTNEADPRCGGGKALADCETAGTMIAAAVEQVRSDKYSDRAGEAPTWTTYAWLGKKCTDCARSCEVALLMNGADYTGIARFTSSEDDSSIPSFDIAAKPEQLKRSQEIAGILAIIGEDSGFDTETVAEIAAQPLEEAFETAYSYLTQAGLDADEVLAAFMKKPEAT